VIDAIEAAAESRDSPESRQGALIGIRCLVNALGMLFEPFVIRFLPMLLSLFADLKAKVRHASSRAALAIMGSISQHGVRQILPKLLDGLADSQWRSKRASIQMLGAMSGCAPR